jgi:hypothetical protein
MRRLDPDQFYGVWKEERSPKSLRDSPYTKEYLAYLKDQPEAAVWLYDMPFAAVRFYIYPVDNATKHTAMMVIETIDDAPGVCRGPAESLEKSNRRLDRMIELFRMFGGWNPKLPLLEGFCAQCGLHLDIS